ERLDASAAHRQGLRRVRRPRFLVAARHHGARGHGLKERCMEHSEQPGSSRPAQVAIGVGALGVAAVLAVGAAQIPSAAGYAGVGPDFLPWAMSLALAVCGVLLIVQALRGGWRDVETPSGAAH